MIKRLFTLLLLFCPIIVFADDTVSFNPPTSDYSVGWLADIFGIVDGVLHGTGSQVVGRMFSVFNAAVMALGGIIITYTMLVSTMNTAHEGEMLGKKWSSIWVPVRATAGFALLVPKASGYCLLQIFVMWIVVQGVGAADKLWSEVLSYLNRGGVLFETPDNPTNKMTGDTANQHLTVGAVQILSGQVCMLGVERILKNKYEAYTNSNGGAGASKCSSNNAGNAGLQGFCNAGPVPSFADSINFKQINTNTSPGTPAVAKMPNFDVNTQPFYAQLNGICGSISWNLMDASSLASMGLTNSEMSTASDARVIAIQQMYSDLLVVAQVMINNDPAPIFVMPKATTPTSSTKTIAPSSFLSMGAATQTPASQRPSAAWATQPYGVPMDVKNQPCTSSQTPDCVNWGATSGGGALFNGTELVSAVMDYTGVIQPTLTMLYQASNQGSDQNSKHFIDSAKMSGWIMAGSYFFDLVKLNNVNKAASEASNGDTHSGLENSLFSLQNVIQGFSDSTATTGAASCPSGSSSTILCQILDGDTSSLNALITLFTGQVAQTSNQIIAATPKNLSQSDLTPMGGALPAIPAGKSMSTAQYASTVFGYAQNALVIQPPGQPPAAPVMFANMMHVNFAGTNFSLPSASFGCGGFSVGFFEVCLGRMIGNILYNDIILLLYNFVVALIESLLYQVISIILIMPLAAFASIFTVGVKILTIKGINPIVGLALMGTYYINFVGRFWFTVLTGLVIKLLLSGPGTLLVGLMVMASPVFISFSVLMLGIGFITAYYVPIIPYMIFLFGSIAWFMSVIEAMVAAPIVAVGIIHPEGHDIFGKGEAAIMILMNVFLRPAMMIIGFVTAFALSYIGVEVLNAGFDRAISFVQPSQSGCSGKACTTSSSILSALGGVHETLPSGETVSGGYTQWAGVLAFIFSILIYTTIYMTLVEKAFSLISNLPDNVLRWIGGQPERHGQEAAQWTGEVKKGVEKAEEETKKAMLQAGKAGTAKLGQPKLGKGKVEGSEGG